MSNSSKTVFTDTTSDVSLQYILTNLEDTSKTMDLRGIIRGVEALSALYSYEVEVESKSTDSAATLRGWLGKRVSLQTGKLTDGAEKKAAVFHTVYGIVTSVVSGPVELYQDSGTSWYRLTIEPAFAAACYSRNRAVYTSAAAPTLTEDAAEPSADTPTPSKVLTDIATRWSTDCVISDKAKTRIPDYLQLVQNDESDYNFFCRLLSTWGLGYYWEMKPDSKDGPLVGKEVLHVYDALGGEIKDSADPLACMRNTNSATLECNANSRSWSIHRGYHNLPTDKIAVQNYLKAFKNADGTGGRMKLSLHDETWDQLQKTADSAQEYSTLHFLNRHFNANSVHGSYTYTCQQTTANEDVLPENVAALTLGRRVTWAKHKDSDPTDYFLTKKVISGNLSTWNMECTGRTTEKVGDMEIGCGVLPRPLQPAADPDMDEAAPLLQPAAWDSPKPRTFMAVVTSNVPHVYQGRNFCRVRELNGEDMWVEMGSPSADSNSGILARPRVDNVLFCMDRGDLSIPIAISAMFRGRSDKKDDTTNAAPLTKLQVMERHSREDAGTQDDNSALTLRSRTHMPQRRDNQDDDNQDDDNQEDDKPDNRDVHDQEISADDLTFVQRPQNVHELADKPMPFSQIQMFSLDNGVKPVEQSEAAADWAIADAVVETTAGFFSEADFSAGYAGCDTSEAIQSARNIPVSRPHLQGISMYSSGDMINQSADHQIMNAGGEIVLTAAQAITLRVGKSYIRISEYGIDISSTLGKAIRPGAYPAYHKEDESERDDTLDTGMTPMGGGHIRVTCGGISNKGPYISNNVVNMFTASTFLGSSFTLSDFSSKLYAPAVTIIGGAALETTVSSLIMNGVGLVQDAMGSFIHSPVYTGSLYNGYKTSGADLSSVFNGLVGLANNVVQFGLGICNAGANLKNLVNPTGSLIKMLPERMTISSDILFETSSTSLKTSSAAAGFIATTENAMFSLAKKAKFGWTVAKMAGVTVNKIISSISGAVSGESDATDTYTYEGEKPSDDVNSFSTSGAGIAEIAVDVATGIGAVILSLIPNPTEAIAASLFGSSKANALGLKNSMTLDHNDVKVNHSTSIAERSDAIGNSIRNIANATNNFIADNSNFDNSVRSLASANANIVTENRTQVDLTQIVQNMQNNQTLAGFTIATGTYNETLSSHV